MSLEDLGEPPTKRRRFFSDSDEDDSEHNATTNLNGALPRSPLQETTVDEASNRGVPTNGQILPTLPIHAPPAATLDPPSFDKDAFENLLGAKVDPEALDIIRANCGNNLEQALNMYFDGTWMRFRKPKPVTKPFSSVFTHMPVIPSIPDDHSKQPHPPPHTPTVQSMPESRYIGAFGVEGWATRSGTNMLKHGDIVKIERQKTQPMLPKGRMKGNAHIPLGPQKMSLAASKRVDVIVRFTDGKGNEIGRLAKDASNWVSSLIDQKVCRFEGICVYAPERLRTNDTIFLQLKCYILRAAFLNAGFQLTDNRHTGLFEEQETAEERDLRLRQVALVRLFQEINLMPTRSSVASEKHKRTGLLQAAETADKPDRSPPKSTNRYVKLAYHLIWY